MWKFSCYCVRILSDAMNSGCAPLSMRFPRQEYWRGLPFPSPGELPVPVTEPVFRLLDCRQILHCQATREATNEVIIVKQNPVWANVLRDNKL